eukprot:GEMP01028958.1.p1 GENE.GEMP01028958.1~~GEMP01028958.1.p1  ORF type:complete len:127 (+),score=38.62 GEMP01028958.1:28-408(+)
MDYWRVSIVPREEEINYLSDPINARPYEHLAPLSLSPPLLLDINVDAQKPGEHGDYWKCPSPVACTEAFKQPMDYWRIPLDTPSTCAAGLTPEHKKDDPGEAVLGGQENGCPRFDDSMRFFAQARQ